MSTVDFKQLVGVGYLPLSRKADCQVSRNLRREILESGDGVNGFTLYKALGKLPYITDFQAAPVRGMLDRDTAAKFHAFAAVGDTIYDFLEQTITTSYSPIANDSKKVYMAASPNTLMVASAGHLYRINAGVMTEIFPGPGLGVLNVVFLKNYFVVLYDDLQQFGWSNDDGATFLAGDVQTFEADANAVLSMKAIHQQVALIGTRITQWYYVGANPDAPFVPQDSGVIRNGTRAPASVAALGESVILLDHNEDGSNCISMFSGYSSRRVSDHGIETAIDEYEQEFGVDDAIGMAYETGGTEFYRIVFPAADASWEFNKTIYDATGKPEWAQVNAWNYVLGEWHRDRANCMIHQFGKVLAGDFENGIIYEMSPTIYHDAGYPLRFERQCPHIVNENKNVGYDRLELGIETGIGLESPLWLQSYTLDPATFAANLATAVGGGEVTADQAIVLQQIYDLVPYTPLNPYPAAQVMYDLGFTPWGAQALVDIGGTETWIGEPPQIFMQYSDDGAKSFHQALKRSLGRQGENKNVYWDRGGTGRDRVYRLYGDFPCKLAITTSWLEVEALLS